MKYVSGDTFHHMKHKVTTRRVSTALLLPLLNR